MAQTATIKIKVRNGTLAQWNAADPVLLKGEIGLVHDGTYPVGFVFGNGNQPFTVLWSSNAFKFTPEANWQLALNAAVLTLNNAITAEANARGNADATITANLNAEISTRITQVAALNSAISAESTTRANADTALNTLILTVEANANTAIATLETNIQNWYGTAINYGDMLVYNPTFLSFEVLPAGLPGQLLAAGALGTVPEWVDPPTGTGDMTRAVYDTDLDGVVDAAEREQILVKNGTGATLTKGTIVYIKSSSSSAAHPEVLKADASTEATSSKTMGAVYEDIANGDLGYIVTSGQVHNLNTSAYSVGTKLWLDTTPGQVTTTPPLQPYHTVFIGFVTRSQVNNGGVVYAIQNGYELGELHDVLITGPTTGDVIYRAADGLWKNGTISGILGYTPADQDLVEPAITPGTVNDYWRGDKSWQTLDKNAVGLSDVDNTSDADKPISTATQAALDLITDVNWLGDYNNGVTYSVGDGVNYNGASFRMIAYIGAAGYAPPAYPGNWLQVSDYVTPASINLGNVNNTSDADKPVSTATQTALNAKEPTITAGTSSQYWRGDKSWQTLDKTAVGLGNVDNTSDANKPVSTATQTALNAKQDTLSLTTTGTSGPATLVGNTLNVPNYASGGGITAGDAIAYAIALG